MSQSQQVYTLTIQPGFSQWEEPIRRYVERQNYGGNMTVYKIDNRISALLAKKRLENDGFIVHLEEPEGDSQSTSVSKIFAGIDLGSN